MKKPFKESKVGKFLTEKLPDLVVDVLPDKGLFGIAKNIIESATVSQEEKAEMLKELQDYEIEVYKLEISDKQNARSREVELAKAGGNDHLMYVAGYVALGAFLVMIYAVIWKPESIQHSPLFHQLMGIIEGVALSVFGYYFGSSMKERSKK
jgi:dihydroxyacetone kinase